MTTCPGICGFQDPPRTIQRSSLHFGNARFFAAGAGVCYSMGVKFPLRTILILAGIWAMAAVVIWISRSASPSPEKLRSYIEAHPLEGMAEPGRAAVIEKAAARLNRLDFDQRRELREGAVLRKFFEGLTPAERGRFLDLTLPEGFRQMMSALNKMTPEKRQRLVKRVLEDIQKNSPQSAERIDEEAVKKILEQGVSSFYEDASSDVKLDFAPVLEELQRNLQKTSR